MSPPLHEDRERNAPPTIARYFVLSWLCAAATIAYIQRNSIAVLESTIRADLGLSEGQMGWIIGIFFLTYGLFQIPGGWVGDRWGARIALPVLSTLWSVATVVTAAVGFGLLALRDGSESLTAGWALGACVALLVARLVAGAAQAGIFPCSAVVIHGWFPGSHWALATGWLSAFQQVGGMFAAWLTGLLVGYSLGWPLILFLYSLPGFLWAGAYYGWFRDNPRDHSGVNSEELQLISAFKQHTSSSIIESDDLKDGEESSTPAKEPVPWGVLLTSWPMWAFCAQQFCRAAAYMFYASWFPTYLQETRSISVSESGMLSSLPVLATFVGTLGGGAVSDRLLVSTGSRKIARQGVSIFGLALSGVLILGAWFVEDATSAVLVISAGSLCAAVAGPTSYALSIEMGGKHVSTVFGAMNMSGSIGAFAFSVAVPMVRNFTNSWDSVLILFALTYLAAAVFWLLFNPSGTVFDRPGDEEPHD